ncbi:MAG: MFS transporter [Actinomycetota bacterium]|nr:MFS transporter [Actinomycetota bacterium]
MRTAPRLLTPLFVLVQAVTFAYFVAVGALLPTLPRFVEEVLAGSRFEVGVVVGAFGVSALLLRPWAGRLGDRRGRRVLVVTGGVVVTASIAGYVLAASVVALLGLRLVTGVGEALFFVGTATVVNDLAPDDRRGEALSLFSLALFGGLAVGPVVGERLLEAGGYDAVWLAAAGCAALATGLGVAIRDTRVPGTAERPHGPLVHRAAVRPGAIILAGLIGQAGFQTFAALYAFQLGMDRSRLVFVVYAAVLLVVRSFLARLPDRFGLRRTARSALALSVGSLLLLATVPTVVGLYAGTVVLALGHALIFPAVMSMAVASVPATERGALVGTFTAFVDLAFALGGTLLGAVASVVGFRGTWLAAAGIAAIGFALLAGYQPHGVRPAAAVAAPPEPHGF